LSKAIKPNGYGGLCRTDADALMSKRWYKATGSNKRNAPAPWHMVPPLVLVRSVVLTTRREYLYSLAIPGIILVGQPSQIPLRSSSNLVCVYFTRPARSLSCYHTLRKLTGSGSTADVLLFRKHDINHNFTSRTRSREYQWQTPVSYLTSTNSWDSPSAKYQLAPAWLTVWLHIGHLACSFYFRFPILEALTFQKMQKLSCVRDITHRLRGILRTPYVHRYPICTASYVKLTPLLNLAFQITTLTAFSPERHSEIIALFETRHWTQELSIGKILPVLSLVRLIWVLSSCLKGEEQGMCTPHRT
jgi:hypothetical protein